MWRAAISLVALTAVVSACGGSGGRESFPAISVVPGTPAPRAPDTTLGSTGSGTPTASASPGTLAPVEELRAELVGCLEATGPSAADAESAITSCVEDQVGSVVVSSVEGGMPILLVDVLSDPACFATTSFLIWLDGSWQVQSAEAFLEPDPGSALNDLQEGATSGRARSTGDELGIVQVRAACGSGMLDEYMLLRLDGIGWSVVYRSADDERTRLGHAAIRIEGDGLDAFSLVGDSWYNPDGKNVFTESNPGPHRYFRQAWARTGDSYELAEESVDVSAYKTLVEFVYALGTADASAAEVWATDFGPVQEAIDLGLVKDLAGPMWSGRCSEGASEARPPCMVQTDDGLSVTVEMVREDEGEWLVSGVTGG